MGLFTALNCAMGNDDAELPMLKVIGPQELMRVSELREIRSAETRSSGLFTHTDESFESCRRSGNQQGYRRPYLPSSRSADQAGSRTQHPPMLHIVCGLLIVEEREIEAVPPVFTFTCRDGEHRARNTNKNSTLSPFLIPIRPQTVSRYRCRASSVDW